MADICRNFGMVDRDFVADNGVFCSDMEPVYDEVIVIDD